MLDDLIPNIILSFFAAIISIILYAVVLSKVNKTFQDSFQEQEKNNDDIDAPTNNQIKWHITHLKQDIALLVGLMSFIGILLLYIAIIITFK